LEKIAYASSESRAWIEVLFRKNKKPLIEAGRLVHQFHDEIFEEIDVCNVVTAVKRWVLVCTTGM
jgi:hypothetical protein